MIHPQANPEAVSSEHVGGVRRRWLEVLGIAAAITAALAGVELLLALFSWWTQIPLSQPGQLAFRVLAMFVLAVPLVAWVTANRRVRIAASSLRALSAGSPHRPVRLVMLGSATAMSALVIIGGWELASTTARSKADAEILNLAGRQRMLSQRVSRMAALSELPAVPEGILPASALQDAANRLESDARRLVQLVDALVRADPQGMAAAGEALAEVAPVRTQLLAAAEQVLAAQSAPGGDALRTNQSQLQQLAEQFLRHMETTVTKLQQASEARVRGSIRHAWIMTGLMLGAVVLILLFIVEPVVRLVRRQHASMAAASKELGRLAAIAQRTTNAVIITDATRRILWANEGFERITGYPVRDVLGRNPGELLQCEKSDPSVVAEIRAALNQGRAIRRQLLNRGKNGREYWLDIGIEPQCDDQGKLVGFMAVETEITEQVDARQRVSTILGSVAEGIVLLDASGCIVETNPAAERILGLSADQLRGRAAIDPRWQAVREDGSAFPGHEHPSMVTLRTGRVFRSFPMAVRLPTGDHRWISVSTEPLRDVGGNITAVVASFADITAQRQQQQRMELVVQAARLGTWDWHVPSGNAVFNARWAEMLGYRLEEIAGNLSAFNAILHPDDRQRVDDALQAHLHGRASEYRAEFRLRRKDGSWAWVLSAGAVIERDPDGKPIRATGVHVDVSAAKELELTLAEAKRQAECANASKSEFLANMSHEIRTPMTAILGFADLLASEGDRSKAPRQRIEYIDTIRRNGEHLLSIINDILDLSKIEAGRMSAERIAISPAALVQDVLSLMEVKAHSKGLRLTADIQTPVPAAILSDTVRLRQILMNLVGNAIKFTESGSVTLGIRCDFSAGTMQFDIADTGVGLSKEQISRLFEAFAQADTSTTRRFGGTGLGLRISKRLAEVLGGDIRVVSEPGRGSTFTLTVATGPLQGIPTVTAADALRAVPGPLTPAQNTPPPEQPPELSPSPNAQTSPLPLAGARILLAEDGHDNQRLICFHLRKAGADVRTVENGRIAVESLTLDGTIDADLLSPPPVDMILTDMQMPDMDGYTATRLLRAKGCTLPIVALTAHAMSDDREKCLKAGCDSYATKPIDRAALVAICAAAITAGHSSRAHAHSDAHNDANSDAQRGTPTPIPTG